MLVAAISNELTGGEPDRLSTMERRLVAAFASLSLELDKLATAMMSLGQDAEAYAVIASAMAHLSKSLLDSKNRRRPDPT
jgi:hypothetical protein